MANSIFKKEKQLILVLLTIAVFSSCGLIQKTSRSKLSDGFYTNKKEDSKKKVYIDIAGETIHLYPVLIDSDKLIVDTLSTPEMLPLENPGEKFSSKFIKNGLDIDFITIPIKLRFGTENVPPQLNSSPNGALFMGFRNDSYRLKYITNPLGISERKVAHFGYSVGLFSGIGNTFMSPTNTNNLMLQEYDGIVWVRGMSIIIGMNSFTVGLAVGYDTLLDKNSNIWIYQNRPWIGLGFGLNLN